jgi:signal peptidase I
MGSSSTKPVRPRTSLRRVVTPAVLVVLSLAAIALLTPGLVFEHFWVPTPSMAATLIPGDHVLVDRLAYRVRAPQRGDVIVFHPPGKRAVYIKRIIGVPGDVISLRDEAVYVNGKRLNEPYLGRSGGTREPTDPWSCSQRPTSWSLTAPYEVPAGTYFVMGDNRTDSDDSRDWGPVRRSAILGEAIVTIWPIGHLRLL